VPPEMKRSVMAWIARDTTNVTCSKNLICLDFLVTFLSKKKVTQVWGATPMNKWRSLFQDNCVTINETKNQ
jgi:hypothetical protein